MLEGTKKMAAPTKNTTELVLRPPVELVEALTELSEAAKANSRNQLAVTLLSGVLTWLRDPDPLADPPHELLSLRRILHGTVAVREYSSMVREEPGTEPMTDSMARAYEVALSAKDQVISLLQNEIERLKKAP